MSLKILSLQLFGKIKPASVIENQRKTLIHDYEEFKRVEKSEELSTFLQLKKWVNSAEFKARKAEIEALRFKGSRECNQQNEFEKLKKTKRLKQYFKAEGSDELKRFVALKHSEKLKQFDALEEYMKEGQFEKERNEIKAKVFKGSVEEKHFLEYKRLNKTAGIKAYKELLGSDLLKKHTAFSESEKLHKYVTSRNAPELDKETKKEFRKLKRDAQIKAYFKLEKSKKLRLYREMVNSHDLKKYEELKAYVDSDAFKTREQFLKDRKKFEKSEVYKKQQKYKTLSSDPEVKFFQKYAKSAIRKNYFDVKDSFDLKRYKELEEIINSEAYKERKAYLQDKKKWEKSEEYSKQKKYLEMKKLPGLVKYFKYKDSGDFDFLKNWEVVFEDVFSSKKLDADKWSTQSLWSEKLLGDNYSMPGDLHVVTNGANISINGNLSIEVRKEKSVGKVWQMPAGFVPTELDYTTGLISTGKNFWIEDGILEAKIRFNPTKQVVSSFYMQGENSQKRVNLLEMGNKNRLGISSVDKNGKVQMDGLDISNLKKNKSYIFSVEKSGKSFTWKINEKEVLHLENQEMDCALHFNASSIVINEIPGSSLPAKFKLEWVKCYKQR